MHKALLNDLKSGEIVTQMTFLKLVSHSNFSNSEHLEASTAESRRLRRLAVTAAIGQAAGQPNLGAASIVSLDSLIKLCKSLAITLLVVSGNLKREVQGVSESLQSL